MYKIQNKLLKIIELTGTAIYLQSKKTKVKKVKNLNNHLSIPDFGGFLI